MNQRLALIIFAFALIVAVVVGFFSPSGEEKMPPSEFRAKLRETINKPSKSSPTVKPSEAAQRNPSSEAADIKQGEVKETDPLTREAFIRKYGEKLEVVSSSDRVIRFSGIAIRSENLLNEQKVKGFRPSRLADLVARAREVLSDARALLRIPEDTQFAEPLVTPGDSTGQVTFQQTKGSVPIYPGGLVTVLLGPDGELRTLDSSIYPVVEVVNSMTLPQPGSSRSILYVTEAEPKAVLRYAYETMNKGTQTITDAQTGAILSERDRRIR